MSGYEALPRDTVKIKTENFESGYLIINAEDFDEDTMELFTEDMDLHEEAAAEAAVAPKRKKKA